MAILSPLRETPPDPEHPRHETGDAPDVAPNGHVDRRLEDDDEGKGDDDDIVHILQKGPEKDPLYEEAQEADGCGRYEERNPVVDPGKGDQLETDVSAHHVYGRMGEVQNAEDVHEERETERDQDVYGGKHQRVRQGLYGSLWGHLFSPLPISCRLPFF